MGGEKNGGVDTNFVSPISLAGQDSQVSVLHRRKKSSKLIVTQPDCEQDNTELQKKDGEIDSDEFMNSILQVLQKVSEIHSYELSATILWDRHEVPDFSDPVCGCPPQPKALLRRASSWPFSLRSEPNEPEAVRFPPSTADLRSHSHYVNLELMFIFTNLLLEILLIALDLIASPQKPEYTLAAVAVSFVAVVVSLIELYFKAMRQGVILKRKGLRFWLQYPSSSSDKPFYTFIDVFGFICALCQFTFAYSYHKRHADNPINISILSLIFIICLAYSKLTRQCPYTEIH